MISKFDKKVVLDEYECKHCGNVLRRRMTPNNIMHDEEIKYCPFCAKEYEDVVE